MRNAEFGSFMQLVNKQEQGAVLGAEDALYNAKGEFLSTWRREFEPDVDPIAGAVWYREMMAGNGPVFTHNDENWLLQHTTKHTEKGGHGDDAPELWNRPKAEAFRGRFLSKTAEADGRGPLSEVFPGVLGELSPVKVDHQMATTVPGCTRWATRPPAGARWRAPCRRRPGGSAAKP